MQSRFCAMPRLHIRHQNCSWSWIIQYCFEIKKICKCDPIIGRCSVGRETFTVKNWARLVWDTYILYILSWTHCFKFNFALMISWNNHVFEENSMLIHEHSWCSIQKFVWLFGMLLLNLIRLLKLERCHNNFSAMRSQHEFWANHGIFSRTIFAACSYTHALLKSNQYLKNTDGRFNF